MDTLKLLLSEDPGKGLGPLSLELGRVTVVLGRNGAGKTTLLNRVADACRIQGIKRRLVSGDAIPRLPGTKGTSHPNWEGVSNSSRASSAYENSKESSSEGRVDAALATLFHQEKESRLQYLEDFSRWEESGEAGPRPTSPPRPFRAMKDILYDFIPSIRIDEGLDPPRFPCKRNGKSYALMHMSAGERQVLFIVADLLARSHEDSLILVDEPELHLHSGLACRLWDRVEMHLPKCRFLYATHGPDFANRRSVERLYLVRDGAAAVEPLDACEELRPEDRREFLGTISGVLWNERILVLEGTDDSLDSKVVGWLLSGQGVQIQSLRTRRAVIEVVRGAGPWRAVLKAGHLVGLVDRDFSGDIGPTGTGPHEPLVLPYHEIESVLCLPDVLQALSRMQGKDVAIENLVECVLEEARALATRAAARGIAAAWGRGPSVSQRGMDENLGHEEMANRVARAFESAGNRSQEGLDPERARKRFEVRHSEILAAIDRRDIEQVLRLVEGKPLASGVLQRLGLGNANEAAETLIAGMRAEQVPSLLALASWIESTFRTAEEQLPASSTTSGPGAPPSPSPPEP